MAHVPHQPAVKCSIKTTRSAPMTPLAAIETAANTTTVRRTVDFILDSSSIRPKKYCRVVDRLAGRADPPDSTLARLIRFRNSVIAVETPSKKLLRPAFTGTDHSETGESAKRSRNRVWRVLDSALRSSVKTQWMVVRISRTSPSVFAYKSSVIVYNRPTGRWGACGGLSVASR